MTSNLQDDAAGCTIQLFNTKDKEVVFWTKQIEKKTKKENRADFSPNYTLIHYNSTIDMPKYIVSQAESAKRSKKLSES